MFCSHCGAQLSENYKFCPKCGTRCMRNPVAGAASDAAPVEETTEKAETEENSPQPVAEPISYITDMDSLIQQAQQGKIEAQLQLAFRYEKGIGVPVDMTQADSLYAEIKQKGCDKDYLSTDLLVECDMTEKSGVISDQVAVTSKTVAETTHLDTFLSKDEQEYGRYQRISHRIDTEHPQYNQLVGMINQYNKDAELNGYETIFFLTNEGCIRGEFKELQPGKRKKDPAYMQDKFAEICELIKDMCEQISRIS